MSAICPACAAAVDVDATACPSCGAALEAPTLAMADASAEGDDPAPRQPTTIGHGARSPTDKSDAGPARSPAPARKPKRPPSGRSRGRLVRGERVAGRFTILDYLGRGGMGEVYRADDEELQQEVALKLLPDAALGDERAMKRLRQEVALTRQIGHPNVVRMFDIYPTADSAVVSMEYVDGEDLLSIVGRVGRLTSSKGAELAREIFAGLQAAHEREVLHRDLKPSNIMIDGRGRARLLDFGLASVVDDDGGERGTVVGTPSYIAPELLEGAPPSVASDLYSAGLTIYAALAGRTPIDVQTFKQAQRAHARGGPPALSDLVSDVDPALAAVVRRCTSPDPSRRPASVAQAALGLPGADPLAAALEAGETPDPSLVAAAGGRPSLPVGQAVAAVVGLVVALVIGAVMADSATWIGGHHERLRHPAVLLELAGPHHEPAGTRDDVAWGYSAAPDDEAETQTPKVVFWSRRAPRGALEPRSFWGLGRKVTWGEPDPSVGSTVVLDVEGRPLALAPPVATDVLTPVVIVICWLLVAVILLAMVAAKRNLESERADAGGAMVLAGWTLALMMLAWAVGAPHTSATTIIRSLAVAASRAALTAGLVWTLYVALEPLARRRWPQAMVGWARVSSGHRPGPLVARDVLLGALGGTLWATGHHLGVIVSGVVGEGAAPVFLPSHLPPLRDAFADLVDALPVGVFFGLASFTFYAIVRWLSGREWMAMLALGALLVGPPLLLPAPIAGVVSGCVGFAVVAATLRWVGLLALVVAYVVHGALLVAPLTTTISRVGGEPGWAAAALTVVLAALAARRAVEA